MDAKTASLKEKLEKLLSQAAAVACEMQAFEQGDETPHFDQVELPAHEAGQRFSQLIQENRSREIALGEEAEADCPNCSRPCKVETQQRTVNSMDGPIEVTETVADCRRCRRSFFPSTGGDRV